MKSRILVGNTYPPALIRRPVQVTPITLEQAQGLLKRGFVSFWGHTNTLAAAREQLGVDVTPETERPAIVLDSDNFPTCEGVTANQVLVLSPTYTAGFRPEIGSKEEIPADKVIGWQCLLFDFS